MPKNPVVDIKLPFSFTDYDGTVLFIVTHKGKDTNHRCSSSTEIKLEVPKGASVVLQRESNSKETYGPKWSYKDGDWQTYVEDKEITPTTEPEKVKRRKTRSTKSATVSSDTKEVEVSSDSPQETPSVTPDPVSEKVDLADDTESKVE